MPSCPAHPLSPALDCGHLESGPDSLVSLYTSSFVREIKILGLDSSLSREPSRPLHPPPNPRASVFPGTCLPYTHSGIRMAKEQVGAVSQARRLPGSLASAAT